jgi:hypothetical protein
MYLTYIVVKWKRFLFCVFKVIIYFKGEEAYPTEAGTSRPRELHFGQLRTHLQVLSDNICKFIRVCYELLEELKCLYYVGYVPECGYVLNRKIL